jgi:hypothetical protein
MPLVVLIENGKIHLFCMPEPKYLHICVVTRREPGSLRAAETESLANDIDFKSHGFRIEGRGLG